ncbi:hypothetical protein KVR01_006924 [Diaporthe batatas]|uniref:uncharacterized protein n=1 Tax=Diaporthe batatas TaxID=748121 RepID=UPI001D05A0DE|nr:uncharacterized protein KVR01_006924 [Diaporthe batatas]KAG8163627.1 hypothetical protein KVR01_006924 [Diaporthe batatas]
MVVDALAQALSLTRSTGLRPIQHSVSQAVPRYAHSGHRIPHVRCFLNGAMAVVMRGWSKTASTALKLATAEKILGYQFKDVDKLYEALDQEKRDILLPSGKARGRPRNSRLALVGDALGTLHLARNWYDKANLGGVEWSEIQLQTLSNERLAEIGFKLGLDECAISKDIVKSYDMATTLEALIAAVDVDGASEAQVQRIYTRFGIKHRLLEPAERSWIWRIVKSQMILPDKFFIGHHFELLEGILETQLKHSHSKRSHSKRLPARKKQDTWLWGHAKRLWTRTKRLWQPSKAAQTERTHLKKKLKRVASRSALQPSGMAAARALAKRSQIAARTTNPPEEEFTNKTELVFDDSISHHEITAKAAATEKTTDTEKSVERHEVAESSTAKASTLSKPTKRQPQTVLADGTSVCNTDQAETGSQAPDTASSDRGAPTPSSVATNGTENNADRQTHDSEVSVTGSAKGTISDEEIARLDVQAKEMLQMTKMLHSAALKIEEAGAEMTEQDKSEISALRTLRVRILDRRSLILRDVRRSQRASDIERS